jgi:hypothetical protein
MALLSKNRTACAKSEQEADFQLRKQLPLSDIRWHPSPPITVSQLELLVVERLIPLALNCNCYYAALTQIRVGRKPSLPNTKKFVVFITKNLSDCGIVFA